MSRVLGLSQVDGSVVTWGDQTSGGKSSKVAQELKAGVTSAAWQVDSVNSLYVNGNFIF